MITRRQSLIALGAGVLAPPLLSFAQQRPGRLYRIGFLGPSSAAGIAHRLEALLTAAPKLKRVGFLADPRSGGYTLQMDAVRRSVARYKMEARFADVASPEEIELALSRLAKEGAHALVARCYGSSDVAS